MIRKFYKVVVILSVFSSAPNCLFAKAWNNQFPRHEIYGKA